MTRLDLTSPATRATLQRLLSHPDVQGFQVEDREGRPFELGFLRASTLRISWFSGRNADEALARAQGTFFPPPVLEVDHG